MKRFNGLTQWFTVSKKCHADFIGTDIIVTGSPSDIRKVVRDIKTAGYYNLYENAPIMREGRTYQVRFPENWSVGDCTYIVSRKEGR